MISPLLSVFSAAAFAPAWQDDAALDGDRLVRMEVFADRSAVRPGERFTLGVRMKIERGWHIYWENPGDSGLATRFDVRAPAGFEVGPTRFPAPERHEQEGDIVTFVHHGELVLLRDVVAPEKLAASAPVRFEVEGRWLACIETCLPGSSTMELTLPVAPPGGVPALANEALFTQWRAALPQPLTQNPHASTNWTSNDDAHVLAIEIRDCASLEFFPRVSDVLHLRHQRFEKEGVSGKLELEFTLSPARAGDPLPERVLVDGVVVAHGTGGGRAFDLQIPVPRSK